MQKQPSARIPQGWKGNVQQHRWHVLAHCGHYCQPQGAGTPRPVNNEQHTSSDEET